MAKDVRVNKTGIVVLGTIGISVLLFLLYYTRGRYTDEKIRLSELISASIYLAEAGGRRIAEIRKMKDSEIGQLSKGNTKEGASEYVTLGDKESHEIITSGLKSIWPRLRYRSEETDRKLIEIERPPKFNAEVMAAAIRDEEVPLNAVTVWIDPLDATQEYTEGGKDPDLLKYVTVMVCIAIEGKPIAGIIHQPFLENLNKAELGVTKWAWVGHGTSRSLIAAVNSDASDPKTVRVIASRSHPGDVVDVAKNAFKDFQTVVPISAAGAGYKSLAVAERNAELYLHTTAIKKWDICAGDALLSTIGGAMTTRRGKEIDYSLKGDPKNSDGIVAALTEESHRQYLERLKIKV